MSADLIYGLPEQTPANWTEQLNNLLSFELEHMSCYQLTIETGTIFHTRARQGDVLTADDDAIAHLYVVTEGVLSGAGLNAYEVSNYAKLGQASAHNVNYWKAGDWLAIGPGAHGRMQQLTDAFIWQIEKALMAGFQMLPKRVMAVRHKL